MSRGLNKVYLIGHMGGDPELKTTPNGADVASFSVATNEGYKDKSGTQIEKTEWHKIVAWNQLAKIIGEYAKKGQQVFIEGKLQTRSWEKDGQKHYMTEIVAQNFQILGRKGEGAGRDEPPLPSDESAPPSSEKQELPF